MTSEPVEQVVGLDQIRPYWRNPRQIPEEAVEAVRESITRYGMNQPILVDSEMVIIIGHTRYAALRRIGATKVKVAVSELSPALARELRVIDNRVGEFSRWDFDSLAAELEELDANLLMGYFPEARVADDSGAELEIDLFGQPEVDNTVGFTCPSCFHQFETQVTKDQIVNGMVEVPSEDQHTSV